MQHIGFSFRLAGFFELFALFLISPVTGQTQSELWGKDGQAWQANGRLPDFSHAGYHQGEKSIPLPAQAKNVKDFGAVGDGIADDTKAFTDAIGGVISGAVWVPEGRYKITDFIYIKKSNIVLKGAGPDKSILWFPKSLNDIYPRESTNSTGQKTTPYSFNFGFLTLEGELGSKVLATVMAESRRGDAFLDVDNAAKIKVGQSILVVVNEVPDQSLKIHLYSGDAGGIAKGKNLDTKMVVKVKAINGKRLELDRPLRFDTRLKWSPQVLGFDPTVSESGIEGLGFEFPDLPYPGHFNERGFNAIELRGVVNCWVRNVSIHNADMGVLLARDACFNTVDGVVVTAYDKRGASAGHHAIQVKASQDNLITRFDLRVKFIHDLSVEDASGNVYANGKGVDLCFDHHRDTPYENLFTNVDVGIGSRVWSSGGGDNIGRHCAGRGTFWNIRASKNFSFPPAGYGPNSMNVIGITTTAASVKDLTGKWLEALNPLTLVPADLYSAQLRLRLTSTPTITTPGSHIPTHRTTDLPTLFLQGNSGIRLRMGGTSLAPATRIFDTRGIESTGID